MTPGDIQTDAVVDTNVFVSSLITRTGSPAEVADAFRAGLFPLITSHIQREELGTVLERPRIRSQFLATEPEIAALLEAIDRNARFVMPTTANAPVVRDPKDQMILATAIAGGAHYLETGDEDLLALSNSDSLPGLRIVTPAAFLAILEDTN